MKEIARQLLAIGAVKFNPDSKNPFVFKSGIKSPIYCDNRSAYGDPDVRAMIVHALEKNAEAMWDEYDKQHDIRANVVIVGVATGAIGWGFGVASNYLDAPFAYARAEAKDHGTKQKIDGYKLTPDDKVIIVEDLISTGGSSLAAVEAVRETGAEVIGMVAIMTYGWPRALQAFEKAGVPLVTLTNYSELISVAVDEGYFSAEEGAVLDNWHHAPENWGK
jgi:orotate phosphoribosyltransferase